MSRGRVAAIAAYVLLAGCTGAVEANPTARPSSSAEAQPSTSPTRLMRDAAIDAAREAVASTGAEWQVRDASSGPLEEVLPDREQYEWARELAANMPVWRVSLVGEGGLSALVVLDEADGSVLGFAVGIAN